MVLENTFSRLPSSGVPQKNLSRLNENGTRGCQTMLKFSYPALQRVERALIRNWHIEDIMSINDPQYVEYHNHKHILITHIRLCIQEEGRHTIHVTECSEMNVHHQMNGASVIRRNAFSPDKGLSGENWRGGARTAAEQPPESKTWDFPKCAGAGGWRKTGQRGANRRWPFERSPHYHSAAAALIPLRKLFNIDLSTEKLNF